MLAQRTRVVVSLVCVLAFLVLSPGRADPDDDKAKSAEAKTPNISKLPNDELLKHANALLTRGSGEYLAAARALIGVETQLNDAAKQLADLTQPRDEPRKVDGPKA